MGWEVVKDVQVGQIFFKIQVYTSGFLSLRTQYVFWEPKQALEKRNKERL